MKKLFILLVCVFLMGDDWKEECREMDVPRLEQEEKMVNKWSRTHWDTLSEKKQWEAIRDAQFLHLLLHERKAELKIQKEFKTRHWPSDMPPPLPSPWTGNWLIWVQTLNKEKLQIEYHRIKKYVNGKNGYTTEHLEYLKHLMEGVEK